MLTKCDMVPCMGSQKRKQGLREVRLYGLWLIIIISINCHKCTLIILDINNRDSWVWRKGHLCST